MQEEEDGSTATGAGADVLSLGCGGDITGAGVTGVVNVVAKGGGAAVGDGVTEPVSISKAAKSKSVSVVLVS